MSSQNEKNMKQAIFALIFGIVVSAASVANAKRVGPPKVNSVVYQGIEYRAPTGRMNIGMIEAWGVKSNRLIWRRQIYVVKYQEWLEQDVQDVFINRIEPQNGALIITNERGDKYSLDLQSLDIQILKGKKLIIKGGK